MIEFDNVHKRFRGGQVGLAGIDLRIQSGDMVFVTGHSGAGKSTLMRLMVLLDRCTSGVLRIGGQDLSRLRGAQIARYRRRVGVVFQEHRLIEDMTIAENVGLPLIVSGMSGLKTLNLRGSAVGSLAPLLALEELKTLELHDATGYDEADVEKLEAKGVKVKR